MKVGAPDCVLEAQYLAHRCFCLRFIYLLRRHKQNLRSGWFATPFPQDYFIIYIMPVYPSAMGGHAYYILRNLFTLWPIEKLKAEQPLFKNLT
jgi:hypothetical protein